MYRDLNRHYEECLEFPLLCPNSCGANLRRKQTDSHNETDCPNTILKCLHEKVGCKEVIKRCEIEEHNKTNEIKHLEMTTLFAVARIEQSEETNTKLSKEVNRLTAKIEHSEEANTKLSKEVNRLTAKIEHSEEANTKLSKEVNRVASKMKQSDERMKPVTHRIEDLERQAVITIESLKGCMKERKEVNEKFFNHFATIKSKSLTQTKSVLEERERIETQIEGLQSEKRSLNKLEQLKKEVEQHKADLARNKDFTYTVDEDSMVKHDLSLNTYVDDLAEVAKQGSDPFEANELKIKQGKETKELWSCVGSYLDKIQFW